MLADATACFDLMSRVEWWALRICLASPHPCSKNALAAVLFVELARFVLSTVFIIQTCGLNSLHGKDIDFVRSTLSHCRRCMLVYLKKDRCPVEVHKIHRDRHPNSNHPLPQWITTLLLKLSPFIKTILCVTLLAPTTVQKIHEGHFRT